MTIGFNSIDITLISVSKTARLNPLNTCNGHKGQEKQEKDSNKFFLLCNNCD